MLTDCIGSCNSNYHTITTPTATVTINQISAQLLHICVMIA
jgi:hypothetical protein